jgi:AcrR family transcriptional regulator
VAVKQNASTFRTRRRIHDAFLTLVETRDVAEISVSDVTTQAGLNRTTFYLHYQDIHALLDAVIDEIMDRLQEGGRKLLEWDGSTDEGWQETFYRTMAERPELFISLLRSTAREKMVSRFMEDHKAWFLARWEKDGVIPPDGWPDLQTCATWVAGGVHALTVEWLESGMPVSPEVLAEQAYALGMAAIGQVDPGPLPLSREDAAG